jgi:hypothetical protein
MTLCAVESFMDNTCGMSAKNGFMSQANPVAHFGLGDATIVDSIIVEWPSGLADTMANVPINQFLPIVEAGGDPDGDGVGFPADNCPGRWNPVQEDTDTDGIGDSCDICPNNFNPNQEDLDGDGIGDSCEINRTWWVFADGSGATPTVQTAIDSSYHGDTIYLADGLYSGEGNRDLDFHNRRGLVIRSGNGPAATIIEREGTTTDPHRWLTIESGIDSTCVIDGITIRSGYGAEFNGSSSGGAILITGSAPTIRNCVFVNNSATVGGAVFAHASSAQFINCTFAGNMAYYGAALCGFSGSTFHLENCLLAFNEQGLPVYCLEGGLEMVDCTDIYGNTAGDWIECLTGWSGINGNMSFDPLFCNTGIGDIGISDAASPCLPPNNACGMLIGALGLACMYPCDCGVWGDVDGSELVGPVDVAIMVEFIYKIKDSRIQPFNCPFQAGDVDCDARINPVDVVWYVNYVYKNLTPFPCKDQCS